MPQQRSIRDLQAFQRALDVVVLVYRISADLSSSRAVWPYRADASRCGRCDESYRRRSGAADVRRMASVSQPRARLAVRSRSSKHRGGKARLHQRCCLGSTHDRISPSRQSAIGPDPLGSIKGALTPPPTQQPSNLVTQQPTTRSAPRARSPDSAGARTSSWRSRRCASSRRRAFRARRPCRGGGWR